MSAVERGALSDADRKQARIRVPFLIARVLVLIGLLVAGLGPLLWLLKASISPTQDSIREPLALFPSGEVQWQNLATAWQQGHIGYYLGNTAIIAAGTAFTSLIVCTTAGYVLAVVLRPRWGPLLSAAILVTLFVPHIVSLVPLYLTVLKLPVVHANLTNTFWAVWLPRGGQCVQRADREAFLRRASTRVLRGGPDRRSRCAAGCSPRSCSRCRVRSSASSYS